MLVHMKNDKSTATISSLVIIENNWSAPQKKGVWNCSLEVREQEELQSWKSLKLRLFPGSWFSFCPPSAAPRL